MQIYWGVSISYPSYLELRQSSMNIKHNVSMNITKSWTMKRLESSCMLTIYLCVFILFLLADLMRLDTRVYTNERPFIIRSLYTSYRDARTYTLNTYSHLIKMRWSVHDTYSDLYQPDIIVYVLWSMNSWYYFHFKINIE